MKKSKKKAKAIAPRTKAKLLDLAVSLDEVLGAAAREIEMLDSVRREEFHPSEWRDIKQRIRDLRRACDTVHAFRNAMYEGAMTNE